MSDHTTVVAVPAGSDRTSNIDWGAVIGGSLVASALSFVLFAFGSAAGVASVSPYSWNNPSGMTLTIIGVAWFAIVMIGSFLVGGYFAGRYRRPLGDAGLAEREARDGAHGILVWALSLVIGLVLAASVAAATARGVASAAGGAAAVASQGVSFDQVGRVMDTMMRPGPGDAANPTRVQNPRAEVGRVLSASALRGEIVAADRDYVAQIVATEARIPPEEARRRVDTAIEQGKQAANTARKVTGGIAFLIAAVSIFAAGAAFWGASAGGRRRDEGVATIW